MDELIDGLIDYFSYYADAKKELKECYDRCEYDAGYFCYREQENVDTERERIKETIVKLIKKVNEDG